MQLIASLYLQKVTEKATEQFNILTNSPRYLLLHHKYRCLKYSVATKHSKQMTENYP